MKNDEYIQYGCGWAAPAGWRNFDASPTLRFERLPIVGSMYTKNNKRFPDNVEYGNIAKGLPVPSGSVRGLYCSHVLEHLALDDFKKALSNSYQLLERGGCFRFVLPDLKFEAARYLASDSSTASIEFLMATSLGVETRARGLRGLLSSVFGNSQHLWMWDYRSIKVELEKVGFSNIRPAQFGDATNLKFNEVENMSRWENALGVECVKLIN